MHELPQGVRVRMSHGRNSMRTVKVVQTAIHQSRQGLPGQLREFGSCRPAAGHTPLGRATAAGRFACGRPGSWPKPAKSLGFARFFLPAANS